MGYKLKLKLISFVLNFLFISSPFLTQAIPFTPEQLFVEEGVRQVVISPDGKYIVFVQTADNTDILTIAYLKDFSPILTRQMGKHKYIADVKWANDKKLLLWSGARLKTNGSIHKTNEIHAMNPDGSEKVRLWRKGKKALSIVSYLPSKPNQLLVRYRSYQSDAKNYSILKRLDIRVGDFYEIEKSVIPDARYFTDKKGNPIFQTSLIDVWTVNLAYKDRKDKWQSLNKLQDILPLSLLDDDHLLLYKQKSDGLFELIKLNRFSLKSEVIMTSANAIETLISDQKHVPIGYRTVSGNQGVNVFFSPDNPMAKLYAKLQPTFPGKTIEVTSATDDFRYASVKVISSQEPGQHFLYVLDNNNEAKLSLISQQFSKIDRNHFLQKQAVSFTARDGKTIYGYLTIPNRKPEGMIVMVHSGIFSDSFDSQWDAEAQFFASHGFSVLQVNYRGSFGYGPHYLKSALESPNLTVLNDIVDGTKWALGKTQTNKDKVCIYGEAFGAYFSLLALSDESNLYQCAIGAYGAYHLPPFIEKYKASTNYHLLSKQFQYLFGQSYQLETLRSPINRVNELNGDILLIHNDTLDHSLTESFNHMTQTLTKAKKPFIQIDTAKYASDKEYLRFNDILAFLKRHLDN